MAGGKGAGAALLMMMVVVFAMVAGLQVSALQTPEDFSDCVKECVGGGCAWYVPDIACNVYCVGRCTFNHIPTADGYCQMGCITSTCITTASSSNSADNEACIKGCADICGSSPTFTPTYKFGRNQVV